MAVPENLKIGTCYIWFISLLLFTFTVAGATFLVLFMVQSPGSPPWYPIIGVSLVCFPWFFWFLTFLYRIVSRACGFRMICFGPFGADQHDNVPPSGPGGNNNGGGGSSPMNNASIGINNGIVDGGNNGIADGGNDNNGDLENVCGNGNENGDGIMASGVVTPRRVHFGGVVVLGEDDGARVNQGSLNPLSSPSSLSSSSSSPRSFNESELPLRHHMAS